MRSFKVASSRRNCGIFRQWSQETRAKKDAYVVQLPLPDQASPSYRRHVFWSSQVFSDLPDLIASVSVELQAVQEVVQLVPAPL